jgi:hypothetical protein
MLKSLRWPLISPHRRKRPRDTSSLILVLKGPSSGVGVPLAPLSLAFEMNSCLKKKRHESTAAWKSNESEKHSEEGTGAY